MTTEWKLPSEAPRDGTSLRVWIDECGGFEHPTTHVASGGNTIAVTLFENEITGRPTAAVLWRFAEVERPTAELVAASYVERELLDQIEGTSP